MALDPYLNFNGDCRQALDFYSDVFGQPPADVLTYDQTPGAAVAPADQDRILHASLPVFDGTIMFSDCASGMPYTVGSNVALSVGTTDGAEATRVFSALAEDGQVKVPLGPQFFNPLFGMVTDRFGINWMVSQVPSA